MARQTAGRPSATRTERRQAAVHRRRQRASSRSTAARRAVRRKRRLTFLAAGAVVAVVTGTVVALALRGDEAPSTDLRAARVAGAKGPLPISDVPASYRAVYQAESYEGSNVTVSTEEIRIRRPFDGQVSIREGKPPGGTVQFEGRSTFGTFANDTERGPAQVAKDAPGVGLGDLRLERSLDDLVAHGLFVLRDRRRAPVAGGRECQVYRTGSPIQSLKITAPTGTDYVDACFDDAGLLLEEVAVVGGELKQRLTAIELETGIALDPAIFAIDGTPAGPEQGGAQVTELDRAVAPTAGYWALDTVPPGFEHRGRYLVQAEGASHVDVYVRGVDLVTVRQGPPGAEPDRSGDAPGRDVELGPLGPAKVVLGGTGPAVIAHPGGDAFVHVAGTLAPAEVQALAASLRRG